MGHEIAQSAVSASPCLPALPTLLPGEGWGEGELGTSQRLKNSSLRPSPQPSPGERGGRKSRSLTKNICFVTGTRAEFGLMKSVLRAIESDSRLQLQLIATGMHLDPAHGDGVE